MDTLPFFAAETGTYKTTSPNPHIELSGTAASLGTYPARTFAAAAADTTLGFDSGGSIAVVVVKDASNYKRYLGAIWTDATPDVIDLSSAILEGSAGTIAADSSVTVFATLGLVTGTDVSVVIPAATGTYAGLLTAADFTKLSGLGSLYLSATLEGVPAASQVLARWLIPTACTLPSGATGSYCKAKTAATASATIDLRHSTDGGNGSSVGSAAFSAAGTVASFTVSSPVSLSAGDELIAIFPASADATLSDVSMTLKVTT